MSPRSVIVGFVIIFVIIFIEVPTSFTYEDKVPV